MRLFTILKEATTQKKTRHFLGLPPELTGGEDNRTPLPFPKILIIEKKGNSFYLFRYDIKGNFAGDTWHLNLEDAKHQAEFEYKDNISEWKEVPEDVDDPIIYALSMFKKD